MKKIITYTEEQFEKMKTFLNMVTITGTQNATCIAIVDQTLKEGILAEIQDSEKKEGD